MQEKIDKRKFNGGKRKGAGRKNAYPSGKAASYSLSLSPWQHKKIIEYLEELRAQELANKDLD